MKWIGTAYGVSNNRKLRGAGVENIADVKAPYMVPNDAVTVFKSEKLTSKYQQNNIDSYKLGTNNYFGSIV